MGRYPCGGYAKFYRRSHSAVIRVYDGGGQRDPNARVRGRVQRVVGVTPEAKSRYALKRDGSIVNCGCPVGCLGDELNLPVIVEPKARFIPARGKHA